MTLDTFLAELGWLPVDLLLALQGEEWELGFRIEKFAICRQPSATHKLWDLLNPALPPANVQLMKIIREKNHIQNVTLCPIIFVG